MERIDDDGLRWLNLWRQERRIASDEKLLQRRMSSLQLLLLIASLAPFVACQSFPQDEVSALNAFKEAIYEDPLLVLSNWNVVDVNPCKLQGRIAEVKLRVLRLLLDGPANAAGVR
ncbi:Probable LRR receptor-like serine/threonine-protein kinase At1g63430 [Linum perenne]